MAYPARLAAWPAVVGFVVFVWLELAYQAADMDAVVVVYTIVALVGMACFGKDRWRNAGEVFSVWFGLLNRTAAFALAGAPTTGHVRRQRFPDGLLGRPWDASLVTLAAVATGAILYDGLSQTQPFVDALGRPGLVESSLLLAGFLASIVVIVLLVGRRVGMVAMGAGLVPISVGYLIAHYLTSLLGDGQRIVVAISDPLQLGWDLFGTASFEPSTAWLPSSILWSAMFLAVVGGHVMGAWAGHLRTSPVSGMDAPRRRAQLPLVATMVVLTTLTLWSLGQAVFQPEPPDGASVARTTPGPAGLDSPDP
jgi:hypothetical protein